MSRFISKLKTGVFSFLLLISGDILAQTDTLSILHITDLHVIFDRNMYRPDLAANRVRYAQGEVNLRQFLKTMPEKTNSEMVVATGDLADFFEAEIDSGKMMDIQAEQFARLVNDYSVPFYLTMGNHDAFSFRWRNNSLKNDQNSSGQARASWIRNLPCFRNGTFYSRLVQVGQTTYRLIFLDDSFYKFLPEDSTGIPYIDKSQLYWLNAQLKEMDNDVEIILMHIPFSVDPTKTVTGNTLFSALSAYPSVKLILGGHHHKNLVTDFPVKGNTKIVQVQTGAFAMDTNNWRQIKLTKDKILVSLPGKTENEVVIPVK